MGLKRLDDATAKVSGVLEELKGINKGFADAAARLQEAADKAKAALVEVQAAYGELGREATGSDARRIRQLQECVLSAEAALDRK